LRCAVGLMFASVSTYCNMGTSEVAATETFMGFQGRSEGGRKYVFNVSVSTQILFIRNGKYALGTGPSVNNLLIIQIMNYECK
jgi:hypothetical protein